MLTSNNLTKGYLVNTEDHLRLLPNESFDKRIFDMKISSLIDVSLGAALMLGGAAVSLNLFNVQIPSEMSGLLLMMTGFSFYVLGRNIPLVIRLLKFYKDRS
jgi:hypothetical protein